MKYQDAVNYINQNGKDLEYDKQENLDFLVFIAPTDPKSYEVFLRNFARNHFDTNTALAYTNEDVCVMRVAKEYLRERAFLYDVIAR